MRIQEELDKIPLPKQYKRNGKSCFLDPYRKRLIEVTPEEIVRQKMARYCEAVLKVPAEYIMLEMPMSKYVPGARGRADIVVHQEKEDGILYPLLIVECKQQAVFLTDQVAEQAARYCDIAGAEYFILTNGMELEIFKYMEKTAAYQKLEGMISYCDMISGNGTVLPVEDKPPRFSMEQLGDIDLMREYSEADVWIFGANTPPKLIPFAVNLYQALLDEEHKLPAARFRNYEILEDLGVRYYDYSNGGGGHFNGLYRLFLMKDSDGESQILSFSVFGTGEATEYDRVNTHRTSYTIFFAAIDKFKVSKAVLEFNVDTFVRLSEGKALFWHNGRISSLPSDELRAYIAENAELVQMKKDKLNLGSLPIDRLLYLDGEEERKFMYTFIEYALLREKFRSQRKQEKSRAVGGGYGL